MTDVGLIRKGAILLHGPYIEQVGGDRDVAKARGARGARTLDAGGRVVLPGFVDSHTHALFAVSRVDDYVARLHGASYQDIATSGGGILASARHLHSASEPFLQRRLQDAIGRFLEHGTTTAEVKSGYGLEVDQELKMLRVIQAVARRAPFTLIPTLLMHDVPAGFRQRRKQFLELVSTRLIPRVTREGLAEFIDVFCDQGYFSVSESRRLLTVASQAGLKLKLHAEQLAATGAARLGAEMGAVSVDHLDRLTDEDIAHLRRSTTIATLLPGSVLHLGGDRYPPARRLIDEGMAVALASNYNPGSSPTLNMQMILSLACTQMRMWPEETIVASTVNGAYAVGRGDVLGSLEPGKVADVVIMDVEDYREIPYYFGMNHCMTVIKNGQVVYRKGSGREARGERGIMKVPGA
jgi:imidazolonepropionase